MFSFPGGQSSNQAYYAREQMRRDHEQRLANELKERAMQDAKARIEATKSYPSRPAPQPPSKPPSRPAPQPPSKPPSKPAPKPPAKPAPKPPAKPPARPPAKPTPQPAPKKR